MSFVRGAAALVILILLVMFLSGSFGDRIAPGVLESAELQLPADAATASVQEETLAVHEEATGTVQAQRHTVVSSRLLATIEEILVRAGDDVRQGDPLIRLDAAELDARAEEARRAVEAAAAADKRQSADLQRASQLLRNGVLSRSEFDQVEALAGVAAAQLEGAREVFNRARINQTYATITAPVSGKVIERFAEPGDTATPGSPLLALYDPTALRIEVPVRESLLARIHPGAEVAVRIGTGETITAVVDELVPQAEPGSRTFLVKVGLPHRADLYSGMFGRILIPAGHRTRLLVPAAAIESIGQLHFAAVVSATGALSRRLVTIGPSTEDGRIELLSGLAAGEVVRLSAPHDLEGRMDVGDQ